jgi:recombination protein RecA
MYGLGISKEGDILDMATALDIVDKSGAWYSYGGERMGQGRENVKSFLKEHADICSDIENKVREAYGLKLSDNGDEEPAEE